MGLLEFFQNRIHGEQNWPPAEVAEHWEKVRAYRRRFENDAGEMLMYDTYMNATPYRREIYSPVPLPREMARYSAALLFSDPPKIVHEKRKDLLDRTLEANGLDPFLQAAAERVASEGRGGLRVIRDSSIAGGMPLLTYAAEDEIVWDIRHGRFAIGGVVVLERRPNPREETIYRLLEHHRPGVVERRLYRGKVHNLGAEVGLGEVEEFANLKAAEPTGLAVPTLVRWDNVPGGYSDIEGLDVLLDRLNEMESRLVDKGRKSMPVTFADRKLADENGEVDLEGIVFTGEANMDLPMGDSVVKTVETAQPQLQSEEHIQLIDHLREMILTHSGFSQSSYGIGELGRSESGTALKLRQARTLLTRAGKERMAREAIINGLAVAMAWAEGARDIREYRPEVMLGDGLPPDSMERSQEIATRRTAGVVSLWQAVREQHPEWPEDAVDEEVRRIREDDASPDMSDHRPPRLQLDDEEGELGEGDEE